MPTTQFTAEQLSAFRRDGYLIIRNFINEAEVSKLHRVALEDDAMSQHSYTIDDAAGKKSKLALWYTSGDDAYGLFTRCKKVVGAVDQLLAVDAPVCHFYSKLMQKEPHVGGA